MRYLGLVLSLIWVLSLPAFAQNTVRWECIQNCSLVEVAGTTMLPDGKLQVESSSGLYTLPAEAFRYGTVAGQEVIVEAVLVDENGNPVQAEIIQSDGTRIPAVDVNGNPVFILPVQINDLTVLAGPTDSMILSSGGGATGVAGQAGNVPLVITTTDQYNNPTVSLYFDFLRMPILSQAARVLARLFNLDR